MSSGKDKRAVCLLSGGLDSTTVLYYALSEGYGCSALTVDYGQLHSKEIDCARHIVAGLSLEHQVIELSMPWKGSALLDRSIAIPESRSVFEMSKEIPPTYVPARNMILLSLAASYAETKGAGKIFFGANALDYSGYPDCRAEFVNSFNQTVYAGTKAGSENNTIEVVTPLIKMDKAEIVALAAKLGVPFERTWSCYQGRETPCRVCDSCLLREKGFSAAHLEDPLLRYAFSSDT